MNEERAALPIITADEARTISANRDKIPLWKYKHVSAAIKAAAEKGHRLVAFTGWEEHALAEVFEDFQKAGFHFHLKSGNYVLEW